MSEAEALVHPDFLDFLGKSRIQISCIKWQSNSDIQVPRQKNNAIFYFNHSSVTN